MLTELLRSTDLSRDERISLTRERDHVESWLVNRMIDRKTLVVYRGINPQGVDRIAALDTVTWLISAIGPRRLEHLGIDPGRLMQVAEQSFECTVAGQRGVDSTDRHEADFVFMHSRPGTSSARPNKDNHRLIWYEGLGQYILTLGTISEYYQKGNRPREAAAALAKADRLTAAFDGAALRNYPQGSAYAYATAGPFFRDGWATQAESATGPASSLIAATWRCLAGLGIDPLAGRELASIAAIPVSLPQHIAVNRRTVAILYGNSEEMIGHAWGALEGRRMDEAIEQAKATIQEWAGWAQKLEEQKQRSEGRLMEYEGTAQSQHAICAYWALNDVGGAYFILGKALDSQGRYDEAAQAFRQVAMHYPLAQVWDPHGWFWSPMEAIASDFVSHDPGHYGNVIPEVLAEGASTGKRPN